MKKGALAPFFNDLLQLFHAFVGLSTVAKLLDASLRCLISVSVDVRDASISLCHKTLRLGESITLGDSFADQVQSVHGRSLLVEV